jgi:hypothetical protein
MKQEDREFLKALQNEMLTQDTVYQASPRFWVVMQNEKEYWVEENTDGIFISSNDDCETEFEGDLKEIVNWFENLDGVQSCKYDGCFLEFEYEEEEYTIESASEIQDFLDKYNEGKYNVGYYRIVEKIMPNTFFLTLRECKEHIKANKHHYNNTVHTYAMTAWRSPQVAKLYEIIENTDWDKE